MDALGLPTSPYRYEDPDELRRYDRSSHRQFDRIAFTLRAVDALRPARTSVIVYRSTRLHIQQGPDLRRGNGARWAMVGVPTDASPESIALLLTELDGVPKAPFAYDIALNAARWLERES